MRCFLRYTRTLIAPEAVPQVVSAVVNVTPVTPADAMATDCSEERREGPMQVVSKAAARAPLVHVLVVLAVATSVGAASVLLSW